MRDIRGHVITALVTLLVVGAVTLLAPQRARSVYSSPVNVVNTSAQPVPTQDNGPYQPVAFRLSINETSGTTTWSVNGPTVPAGKRLVVEDVSVFGLIPSNSLLSGVWLVNNGGINFVLLNPQTTERVVDSGGVSSIYGYNREAKAYFEPGDVITLEVFRDVVNPPGTPAAGFNLINVYVRGHYVNLP